MNVLLTNDDGISSEGLNILYDVLSEHHNVFILAPDKNRSAVSQCITMKDPLQIKKVSEKKYSCSGFPADCVIVALRSDVFPKIDVVVSGINYGANIGTDIIYSGTCAAARQAVLYGVPGIALSVNNQDLKSTDYKFMAMAKFTDENFSELIDLCQTTYPYLFVNCNGLSLDSYKGMKIVKEMSVRDYGDQVKITEKGDNLESIFLPGFSKTFGGEDCDYNITNSGYVSVSRIYAEPCIASQ